ncbi:Bifunctional NAD(P)H-hydrate repair enzyme Nnr [Vibrio stylophorae]|uniref:Bifunctional NAD(P)H-hydrate repair enzyme n=2 Tax=Vibrio stylophorae TaxID=659351 RepID=A0ABM8ZTN6_9VIBR|nr:Bifunctional NAD(P)H-hydrate repair enzyme Nnr [Vibrio stylophorae]
MHSLPLYCAEQIRQGEIQCAQSLGISLYQLMQNAGHAVAMQALSMATTQQAICVICGSGNNGGDGYIAAIALSKAGRQVCIIALTPGEQLSGDARLAYQSAVTQGVSIHPSSALARNIAQSDLIIDAILGIGLSGSVRPHTEQIIQAINRSQKPVLSIDIPSGLNADTGQPMGETIIATQTLTLIGIKQGLVTGKARDHVGTLTLADLACAKLLLQTQAPRAYGLTANVIGQRLLPRKASAHKGNHGKLCCIGGNQGMSGAICLTTQAALRSGAGLIKVLTHPHTILPLQLSCIEAMTQPFEVGTKNIANKPNAENISAMNWASHLILGPGLGTDAWATALFHHALQQQKPMVLDADALTLLAKAQHPLRYDHWILTPHPGEAARLLQCSVSDIEHNRYQAVKEIQQRYGGVVVLKGAGSLICDGYHTNVCLAGNPGMATGGMGDVLTGIIGALLAQNYSAMDAARLGVLVHSHAADTHAQHYGQIGLLARDVIQALQSVFHLAGQDRHNASANPFYEAFDQQASN